MEEDTATDLMTVVLLGNEREAALDCPHDHLPTTTMRTSENEGPLGAEGHLGQEDRMSTRTFPPIIGMIQVDGGTTAHHHEMIANLPGTTAGAAIVERIAATTGTVAP